MLISHFIYKILSSLAGIYIHIPFCKKACSYCDFHFSTSLKYKSEMVDALQKEIALRKDYLNSSPIETIYFGGGTPSLLSNDEINRIFDTIEKYHNIDNVREITLEANPDDLDAKYLFSLKNTNINRLSIGIQSFVDEDLLLMNRSHNASEAEAAIKRSQDVGFENLNCDLIFGTPTLNTPQLINNIVKLNNLQVPHISAYSLTIEDRTALAHKMKNGTFTPSSDSIYEEQMITTMRTIKDLNYEQYEISNYAIPGFEAIHNTNYWKQIPYLGIGPSAHSYNGYQRSWNVRNNAEYLTSILKANHLPIEVEHLSEMDKINEFIMVSLRTKWGLNMETVQEKFGNEVRESIYSSSYDSIQKELLFIENGALLLTEKGKLIADHITSELFLS